MERLPDRHPNSSRHPVFLQAASPVIVSAATSVNPSLAAKVPTSLSSLACLTPVINPGDLLESSSGSGEVPPQFHVNSVHIPSCSSALCSVAAWTKSPLRPPFQISSINADKLQAELVDHPHRSRVAFVISGLRHGFRLGFNPHLVTLNSSSTNMPSAFLQPAAIDEYLQNELDKGRVAGPFVHPPWPNLHVSHFGVIPKKHQPGKWRLILDLSSPPDASVNDGIPRDSYSVHYMTMDDIIDGIMRYGRGTLMAKFDVESAYRNVTIHPEDHFLLGMQWSGWYFVDMALRHSSLTPLPTFLSGS